MSKPPYHATEDWKGMCSACAKHRGDAKVEEYLKKNPTHRNTKKNACPGRALEPLNDDDEEGVTPPAKKPRKSEPVVSLSSHKESPISLAHTVF